MSAFADSVFLIEAIVKISALGFAMDEGSYLRDNWNRIDKMNVENIIEIEGLFIAIGQETNNEAFSNVVDLENGYIQELGSHEEEYVPDFNLDI